MSQSPADDAATSASRLTRARLVDAAGHRASILSVQDGEAELQACIQLSDSGPQVIVPVHLLIPEGEDSYRLPFAFDNVTAQGEKGGITVPVLKEELQVGKRLVDTGRGVRLHKAVIEETQQADLPLLREELNVEHVPIGQVVSGEAPEAHYEGDTFVVPVLEEVLVVQKQLMLKEEVRITRKRQQVHEPQNVQLRREQVEVERFDERTP
ncbi:YsnF/AvaK domain-containing protein [Noviherbaspirillum massiliense]|uniref:YsnF/AvaK domain-containing protein n=1 Tax=Noviherbaspirillum massiliense TaxID=1465823 RepID=UPI0003098AFF|nr:YsnF/AvaK domain-containing protein [Noviherbaspirillum massiliense]